MPPSTRSTVSAAAPRQSRRMASSRSRGLEADGFERGAGDLGRAGVAGEAEDRAARLGVPPRRAEAGEGRHQIDLLRVGSAGRRHRAGLVGAARRSPSPSRSHCTAAPATKIEPSSA